MSPFQLSADPSDRFWDSDYRMDLPKVLTALGNTMVCVCVCVCVCYTALNEALFMLKTLAYADLYFVDL